MEFKQAVVTQNGRALMAKLLAGKSTQFTKIKVSSTIYPDAQLANLTALTNIKQEAIAQAYGNNTATISVVGAIENTDLQTGYYINTVGLYAMDPDKGEILYSVSSASVNGYMPPDTGVSKSGFEFKIYTEVGNATKVDLTVDPAAFATHEDIERISTLKTAYSWSQDGNDRFTQFYPEKNVVKNKGRANGLPYTVFDGKIAPQITTATLKSEPTSEGVIVTRIALGNSYILTSNDLTSGYAGSTDLSKSDFKDCKVGDRMFFSFDVKSDNVTQYRAAIWGFKNDSGVIKRLGVFSSVAKIQILDDGYVRVWQFWNIEPNFVDYQLEIPTYIFGGGTSGTGEIGSTTEIKNVCMGKWPSGKNENEVPFFTPAPSEDYENAYPDYIGLAPGYSDKPEDYVWLPEPTKNQKKLDELIELKGQVSDIQDWIQAHS